MKWGLSILLLSFWYNYGFLIDHPETEPTELKTNDGSNFLRRPRTGSQRARASFGPQLLCWAFPESVEVSSLFFLCGRFGVCGSGVRALHRRWEQGTDLD